MGPVYTRIKNVDVGPGLHQSHKCRHMSDLHQRKNLHVGLVNTRFKKVDIALTYTRIKKLEICPVYNKFKTLDIDVAYIRKGKMHPLYTILNMPYIASVSTPLEKAEIISVHTRLNNVDIEIPFKTGGN